MIAYLIVDVRILCVGSGAVRNFRDAVVAIVVDLVRVCANVFVGTLAAYRHGPWTFRAW